ncbi:hypothetical protein BPAE_0071g00140 [Botrytis paeoniae]|uniref:Uncharacterized protein n=1 Tax=Botrytis paeoniae TaxID=278948 RepID=A0A4Z1FUD8_9HELO|nr:hypothetical protein BPAE_0071g00140 [Botrytis paeoniae]
MVRPTGVMLELKEFRKSPELVMARDRKPKKTRGQGRDEEGSPLLMVKPQMDLFRPEMREASPRNFRWWQ